MNVDVMMNGRPWKVSIEPGEQPATRVVTIKGKRRVVDVSLIDDDTLSLIDGGVAREVRFHSRDEAGALGVEIGGRLFEAVVSSEARLKSRPTDAGATGASGAAGATGAVGAVDPVGLGFSQAIKAPMPGRVVRVLVSVGDHVTARQGVVVVEAMKMENELRTRAAGIVREVLVVPGATVETGAVLVVVAQ